MSEAHTMQRVPSCTKTRDVELKCLTLQRKESDHPGKGQLMTNQAENPVTGTVAVTRQHEGSDVREAREDPGRPDREAYIQQKIPHSAEAARQGGSEGPNEAIAEFRDVGTPACTRQRETVNRTREGKQRIQTADRVVVKYLDRKARAPTANRRPRSGVVPDGESASTAL